jgi:hypothetical protein
MLPIQFFNTTSNKSDAQQTLQGLDAGTQSNKHDGSDQQLSKTKPSLHRHYSSLQEHAEQLQVEQATAAAADDGVSPHPGSRRDGLSWGLKPAYDDNELYKHNRNPLPPEQLGRKTPPTLVELMRRPTNEDADTAHNARVSRGHVGDLQLPTEDWTGFSTTNDPPTRRDTRKSSIACFARGLARHIPDMRLVPPSSTIVEQAEAQATESWESGSSELSTKGLMKERKPSYVMPITMRQGTSMEKISRQTSLTGGSQCSGAKQLSAQSSAKSSLRDRRKVNLDLSFPGNFPKLPGHIVQFSGVTPSRPRSPKTPQINNESPRWLHHATAKSIPILEESCASQAMCGRSHEETDLLPDNDPIVSSQSPKLKRPSKTKLRDRYGTLRRPSRRDRSGHSEINEDVVVRTSDGSGTPDDSKVLEPQQVHTAAELTQLSEILRTARASRWRWARSATRSSDGTSSSALGEPGNRRASVNPFKRSGRIAEQAEKDCEPKPSPSPPSRLWWIGKQPAAARRKHSTANTLAKTSAVPELVPPGLNRIPTPLILDASGEVKSKLAGFLFDHAADIEGRRPRSSPGGHWDSDALLMSYLSPDTGLDISMDEEEGPEGPAVPEYAPRGFTVDRNSDYDTLGVGVGPQSYMDATPLHASHHSTRQGSSPEVWFRVPQCVTPVEKPLTPLALRDMDERKRFEWVVPEHLPNSPLCPLHPKYTGHPFGRCLWHGQWSESIDSEGGKVSGSSDLGDSVITRRGRRGWEVGRHDAQPEDVSEVRRRKRRLASLSSP